MNSLQPIHTLRIALTGNGREDLTLLAFEQIRLAAKAAVAHGIRRFDFSGGEPLLREDIPLLLMMLSSLTVLEDMTMTTDGVLLPRWAKSIRGAGIRRVTVKLDTFDPAKYRAITGGQDLTAVLAGIRAMMEVGFPPATLEVRLIRGFNDDELSSLANLTRMTGVSLRLLELTRAEAESFSPDAHMTCEEALSRLPGLIKDDASPTAFRLPGAAGAIESVSCDMRDAGCLLLSADGMLSIPGASVSIRDLSEEEIGSAVASLLKQA